jgi:hypothetical protein
MKSCKAFIIFSIMAQYRYEARNLSPRPRRCSSLAGAKGGGGCVCSPLEIRTPAFTLQAKGNCRKPPSKSGWGAMGWFSAGCVGDGMLVVVLELAGLGPWLTIPIYW